MPGKNKACIRGKPVIEYTVSATGAAKSVCGIIVTTDDPDIIEYYRGREDIFLVVRRPELSQDDTKSSDVVAHAIGAWEGSGRHVPGSLLLAQPTTPLRTSADIDRAFELFLMGGRPSLVSACKAEGIRHPRVMYRLTSDGLCGTNYVEDHNEDFRRQDYEAVYQRNGAIYIVTTQYFRRTGRLQAELPVIYQMPWERSINIDVPGDLLIAKALIESGLFEI